MKVIILNLFCFFSFLGAYAQNNLGIEECLDGKTASFKAAKLSKNLRVQYPGDGNIDVGYYKLDLNIDYKFANNTYTSKFFKGIVTIKAKSKVNSLTEINLDLQNALVVDSIYVNGAKVIYSHISAKVKVNLLAPLNTGDVFTTIIYYGGLPGSTGFGSFEWGQHGNTSVKEPAIWSLSEPFGASDWFPCKDNPADKADSVDVWITAPKEMVSVSNGTLIKMIENSATNTYQWKSKYPIANYLISIALAKYEKYSNEFTYPGYPTMPVDHYSYSELNTPANKLLMDETVFMLNLFSEKFGIYPFINEKYGHANFGWGGGMEHQTCSSMASYSSGLVAHELGHQWFGDKITCANWNNIWLNEGFATYAALVYWEAKLGAIEYKNQILSTMNSAKNAVGPVHIVNPNSVGVIFNGARSYSKGGIILHMLRGIVGETKFYQILKNYIASPLAYGNAFTEDFQAIAEQVHGSSLEYFFKEWVYGERFPKYEFGWNSLSQANAKVAGSIYFTIDQIQNLPGPAFFTMPVQLKITYTDNTSEYKTVFNDQQKQNFTIAVPKAVSTVEFDPQNFIMKDLTIKQINTPLSLEEEKSKILKNEPELEILNLTVNPNPTSDKIKIGFVLKNNQNVTIDIVSSNGKILRNILTNKALAANVYEFSENVGDISDGVYLLKVLVNDILITKKIQIKN